jgi:poly(A) polymerase
MESGIFYVLFPFYQPAHEAPDRAQNRELLLAILAVVDRLHSRSIKLPDQLLFSLVLLPWAITEFDLLHKNYKGPEFHRFLHKTRDRLDEILGPMSIKRSHKESMAMHLVNLPQFIRFSRDNSWPKWLKRKSYYRECDLVFRIFSEATTGKKIPEHIITESVPQLSKSRHKPSRKYRYKKRGTPGPAFTAKNDGGIFGLKK